jgi:hypothetical protein
MAIAQSVGLPSAARDRALTPPTGQWYPPDMPVLEDVVASVVNDTSERMSDPQFAQIAVGHFAEAQPHLASYVSGRASSIGGAQGVLEVAFHAELLCECLRKLRGKELPVVPLRFLERAAKGDTVAEFTAAEPALASYVASNVESERLRLELCRVGLALVLAVNP